MEIVNTRYEEHIEKSCAHTYFLYETSSYRSQREISYNFSVIKDFFNMLILLSLPCFKKTFETMSLTMSTFGQLEWMQESYEIATQE